MRRLPLFVVASLLAAGGVARAQAVQLGPEPSLPPLGEVVETHAVAWPLMIDAHVLLGIEPHGERGTPIAFGAGAELLWKARLGGFAELLSSGGTGLIAPTVMGVMEPGFADRISVPFGLASRPLAPWFINRSQWWARLLDGIGVQLGLTVEHLRTSDDATTTAGLHAALSVDVPLYGGPKQGGAAIRLAGRLMVTPTIFLDNRAVAEPATNGQLFIGFAYYP